MDVSPLLAFGVKEGASDCHLRAGEPPLFRIHGDLKRFDHPDFIREKVHLMLYDIMNDAERRGFEEKLEIDFSSEMGEIARVRVNVFMQRNCEAALFRTIEEDQAVLARRIGWRELF
jgi:twitching motility protein PilT